MYIRDEGKRHDKNGKINAVLTSIKLGKSTERKKKTILVILRMTKPTLCSVFLSTRKSFKYL